MQVFLNVEKLKCYKTRPVSLLLHVRLWCLPYFLGLYGHRPQEQRGRSDDRGPWTACEHDGAAQTVL